MVLLMFSEKCTHCGNKNEVRNWSGQRGNCSAVSVSWAGNIPSLFVLTDSHCSDGL